VGEHAIEDPQRQRPRVVGLAYFGAQLGTYEKQAGSLLGGVFGPDVRGPVIPVTESGTVEGQSLGVVRSAFSRAGRDREGKIRCRGFVALCRADEEVVDQESNFQRQREEFRFLVLSFRSTCPSRRKADGEEVWKHVFMGELYCTDDIVHESGKKLGISMGLFKMQSCCLR
jgi:hypothetical protein